MIKLNRKNKKNGFAILETLLYVSFFALLSIVVINAMIVMMKSFKEIKIQSELIQGSSIMEKISREVKRANSISSISATDLKLDTKDDVGVAKTVRFVYLNNNINFYENDVLIGNINGADILVTNLSFTQITTVKGKAVKIILTAGPINDSLGRTEDFYDTLVLRGDY